jgi:hypothetical protein
VDSEAENKGKADSPVLLTMVPYPSLCQPLLDQLALDKECKEVDALCKKIKKKQDENDYSKKQKKQGHCFQIFLLTYFR